jgi:hypothetical protein
MGRMKEVYMDLYYNTDGNIPLEYDPDGYLHKISVELKIDEEYVHSKETNKSLKVLPKDESLDKKRT